MSDTPLTDARLLSVAQRTGLYVPEMVYADFARDLEFLLATAKAEIERMRPVVVAAVWHEKIFRKINHPNCSLCKKVTEYEKSKPNLPDEVKK